MVTGYLQYSLQTKVHSTVWNLILVIYDSMILLMMFAREICLVDRKYDIKHLVPHKVIYHGIHKGLKKIGLPVSWKSRQTYCY
jgi:hypothetical protein